MSEILQSEENTFYRERAKEFVELHDQVQTSVNLLDSLETFLSTFQKDLSAVSGQISELQDRSREIESRLESRKRIEKPLSSLLLDLTISPNLTTIILDTPVGEPWISAVSDFEVKLIALHARSRVKAARDLGDVAEGLRIVIATKLRAFFLALIQPIKASITTNIQVLQTTVFLKYAPLFGFLQRHANPVAQEVQRQYMTAARTYYETGFRRYIRSLGYLKTRALEKPELVTSGTSPPDINFDRLALSRIEGPSVTLAFLAEDKTHNDHLEAVFRSLLLVLMDNATSEFKFIVGFFGAGQSTSPSSTAVTPLETPSQTPPIPTSPRDALSPPIRDASSPFPRSADDITPRNRARTGPSAQQQAAVAKVERAALDATFKQVMEPVLDYCQTFVTTILDPVPPVIPLLTMIRLCEDVVTEVQMRQCGPLESYIFGLRLQMWPIFQKVMTENIDALKKLSDGSAAGLFSRASSTSAQQLTMICKRYVLMFNSFVALTEQAEETMIFSNLIRLRQELTKLIIKHSSTAIDTVAQATVQSTLYETVLHGLSTASHLVGLPKSQKEKAYWAEKEEEARRRIVSAGKQARR